MDTEDEPDTRVPLAQARPKPVVRAPEPVARRRGRVLVVDDDALVVQAVTRVLATTNDVTALRSGREAQELLREGAEFDVVLCDLMMPGMGGAELFEWVAAQRPDVLDGFVFLTGGATDPRSADLLARRPNLYVEKPFSPLALRKFVAELVEARRG